MKAAITFSLDTDQLSGFTDQHVALLWHIVQANPADYGDTTACELAEHVGHEIIRRFVSQQPPALWTHQGRHPLQKAKMEQGATVEVAT